MATALLISVFPSSENAVSCIVVPYKAPARKISFPLPIFNEGAVRVCRASESTGNAETLNDESMRPSPFSFQT